MIEVQLFKNGELNRIEYYRRGVHAVPDEHGWISILDDDGLVLGMHHKDHVIAVLIKDRKEPIRFDSAGNAIYLNEDAPSVVIENEGGRNKSG